MAIDQDTIDAIVHAVAAAMTAQQHTGGKVDTKAIGSPPEWNSNQDEGGFVEWHIKIKAWLANHDSRAQRWLNAARDADELIETDDLDVQHFNDESERGALKRFNGMLYNILVTKLRGEAFNIASSVRDACGLEAWRLVMKRYEPRTPGTKRALLKVLFNMKAARKVEEIERNLLRVEEIYSRYETMTKEKMQEDIKTVIMTELCTPELKEYLEFNNRDVSYKDTREAIMAYVERKRKDPLTAMEVGNHECEPEWWSGTEDDYQYQDFENCHNEVNYNGYAGKGKGLNWTTKGKGKGLYKGSAKGGVYQKGGGKDKGKGKGKKGAFQGECHWCGKWGHTASRCPDKDDYMDWVRGSKGQGKNQVNYQREANILQPIPEEEAPWKPVGNPVAMLETENRYVDISNVDAHFPKLTNRYSVLSENDVDYEEPMKVLPNSVWATRNNTEEKRPVSVAQCCQRSRRTRWERKVEVGSVSIQTTEVSNVNKENQMELTIDSGAGENVMPGYMAPYTPVTTSKEAGAVYTAANGDMMPNRGCKRVKVTTMEGQLRTMNMQITDVNRALMSVAKICDAGHTVTFTTDGGVIRNNKSGEETKFRRENNVYRMTVKLNELGFARQG